MHFDEAEAQLEEAGITPVWRWPQFAASVGAANLVRPTPRHAAPLMLMAPHRPSHAN